MTDSRPTRQVLRTADYDDALAALLQLNATDLHCLELAIEEPGVTAGRLAQRSGLTSGAVTGVLDRLERAGFIERRPDPADRRSITVQPVTAMADEARRAMAPLDEALGRVLAERTPAERSLIDRFLDDAQQVVAQETARLRAATRGGFVGDTFRAPLGDATHGRLVFASGAPRIAKNIAPLGPGASARLIVETSASRLEFKGAAPDGQLIAATFDGPRPEVRAAGGTVTIRYRRQALAAFASRKARIALSGAIPWTIELDGGLTDLSGSLEGVALGRLDVEGGTNHVNLDLPRPRGTVSVRLHGVASRAALRRPAGVPVSVLLAGGISSLRVDGRGKRDVAGKRRYVSDAFETSPDRYELEVLGGAASVVVEEDRAR